jgi:hypothetical protein
MSHPRDAASRRAIRSRIVADAVERARREALTLGLSMKCSGRCNPDGVLTEPRPWHADEPGGCANDGSNCLCQCHDQPDPPCPDCGATESPHDIKCPTLRRSA